MCGRLFVDLAGRARPHKSKQIGVVGKRFSLRLNHAAGETSKRLDAAHFLRQLERL